MGYYIEVDEPKHVTLVRKYGAKVLQQPKYLDDGQVTICVIDNGPFRAAGICYNESEFQSFAFPDDRPRVWLSLPAATVFQLCPYVKDVLYDPAA